MRSKNVLHRNFYLNGNYGVDFIACQRKLMREGSAGVNNNLWQISQYWGSQTHI